jgi:hypothetical protein
MTILIIILAITAIAIIGLFLLRKDDEIGDHISCMSCYTARFTPFEMEVPIEDIQHEAYLIAERDGFKESQDHYWFEAESKLFRIK